MKKLFSDQKIELQENSIFLAGPTLRNSPFEKSWRRSACEKLEQIGYDGLIYNSEYSHTDTPFNLIGQAGWERECLMHAGCILFYLCRKFPENPGLTTNAEFGTFLSKRLGKCIVCSPYGYDKNEYLEWLYKTECKEAGIPYKIYRDIDKALAAAAEMAAEKPFLPLYNEVLEYVSSKHSGQVRRSGEPVINHPVGVAEILKNSGYDEYFQIVALCHDLLEDTDTTAEELAGFLSDRTIHAQELVKGVISLTKTDDMTLEESLSHAKINRFGRVIKGADRLQNAMTTYGDKNSQEFISGFIYKSIVYYLPVMKEVNSLYVKPLIKELHRLYMDLVPEAKEWEDAELAKKNVYVSLIFANHAL